MSKQRSLGTCYYPEHWDSKQWLDDAKNMRACGLTWVRIGEFSWSRIEPAQGEFDWEWLDQAIGILGRAGLKIVLGTPTATPPRWMLDLYPDMLAIDQNGHPRKFGSRRHYDFSHRGYLQEAARITQAFAKRYGQNPYIAAWQTDNEYGCHDTVLSYSEPATLAFRDWLAQRYQSISALNRAWGNVFWSMEYTQFDDIDLPNLSVTEANPAHRLAFRRFASAQVSEFNAKKCHIIRQHSNAPITHNYMGRTTEFDHFAVGDDCDFASWDSYPLGFLEDRVKADEAHKNHYSQQGDPDFQAFHHDLYRAVGRERWWVMEQQPGPVNWAPYNPSPLAGMVRLWTWEAFAHGAECVSYFRWRQVPFAQEQLHAGLRRPDDSPTSAHAEAHAVCDALKDAHEVGKSVAKVAIIFDYESDWYWAVQPHGRDLNYFDLVFDHYKALRRAGLSIDFLPPSARNFTQYSLILAPGLMHLPDSLKAALIDSNCEIVFGPRAASRDQDFAIPTNPLPPDLPNMALRVLEIESLRPSMSRQVSGGGAAIHYREQLETLETVTFHDIDQSPVLVSKGSNHYLGIWGNETFLNRLISWLADQCKLPTVDLPKGVRVRDTHYERFWFNHNPTKVETPIGTLPAAGVYRELYD